MIFLNETLRVETNKKKKAGKRGKNKNLISGNKYIAKR